MILLYQPIIDLRTGLVTKVEALARSSVPGQAIAEAVEQAEHSGKIKRFTDEILDSALADWHRVGLPNVDLSLNLSLANLAESDLPKRVAKALKRHHIDANRIWFEIGDRAQEIVDRSTLQCMAELRKMGARFSIDGFGNDVSRVTFYDVQRLPISELKIDGSIVNDADVNITHRNLVTFAVNMGRDLSLVVSAKGIERDAIPAVMRRLGCTFGQGYFFGRPVGVNNIRALTEEIALKARSAAFGL
jgi:EAL domain-containing protein (putative c-di-GMP-specific phosphodiesterase class I)